MKDYGYKVWYWLGGSELRMTNCGRDAKYAWGILEMSYPVGYKPWLEYTKEVDNDKETKTGE